MLGNRPDSGRYLETSRSPSQSLLAAASPRTHLRDRSIECYCALVPTPSGGCPPLLLSAPMFRLACRLPTTLLANGGGK